MQQIYQASVTVNDDIIYQYSYGDWKKFKDGQEVISAKGYSYQEFIAMIQANNPLHLQSKILIMTK